MTPRLVGRADVRKLVPALSFVKNKANWQHHFVGSLGNYGKPISEDDYKVVEEELQRSSDSSISSLKGIFQHLYFKTKEAK